MIVLPTTNDDIEVILAGTVTTNQLDLYAAYRDLTSTTYIPGANQTATNNTTVVHIVPSPAADTQRVIDYMSAYNRDTVTQNITLRYDSSGTERILWKGNLAADEKVEYTDNLGWRVFDNQGVQKMTNVTGAVATSSSMSTVVLGSNQTNNNAIANTIQDVTGLSFAVSAGSTYFFRFIIAYTAAATTTGSRFSINGPGSPTFLAYNTRYSLSASTGTDADTSSSHNAYDNPSASNATSANTTGNIAVIEGIITPSSNGTLIARFASEVASSAIVAKAGSVVYYQQVV